MTFRLADRAGSALERPHFQVGTIGKAYIALPVYWYKWSERLQGQTPEVSAWSGCPITNAGI